MRYKEERILAEDPFQVVDQRGVGQLIEQACRLGGQALLTMFRGLFRSQNAHPLFEAHFRVAAFRRKGHVT